MTRTAILPPTFFLTAAIVSVLLQYALPITTLVEYPVSLAGLFPITFGSVLNIWADRIFKKRKTTVKPFDPPSAIVVDGPFALCRHPMYVGMDAILIGISLLCGSLSSFAGPIAFWLVIRIRFVPSEEKSMAAVFGEDYRRYQMKVRSWI